ncbi:P22 coat protein - protein 5 domain protein [Salimicrobium halophilum]|uniref:P22 coat protein-gene protein 5 n=1 Tax=Salimicrobium halophilum TaxID=86666 RepID=A0A1G8WDZ8_9BACI|nr:P22 coat protein - protein 5 domain protein [Salimicrobium halophilum]SDJ76347.1 hypothetical protein SAMN04490247_3136 [Salimicrobium halophilum]
MTVQNFIPAIWSARLLDKLRKNLVFGTIVNTDYEGEIRNQGDTVKVNQIGSVTIGDYDKSTGTGDPEELDSTQQNLVIDQAKYFNFKVEDVDAAQANTSLMEAGMEEANYGLTDVMDQFIAGFYTDVDADNTIGSDASPISVTKDDAYDYLVDLGVKLSEANVPKGQRWCVIPEFYLGLINKDPRFTKEPDTLANGYSGTINGMRIYTSNNAIQITGDGSTTFDNYKVMAGHRMAISFAMQISSIEAYRPEKSFSDAVKGLQVYGAKVLRPSALAVLSVSKG